MNKTEMAMIDAQPSSFQSGQRGDIIPSLQSYTVRYADPYLSCTRILDAYAGKPLHGTPYWMQGLYIQTCNNKIITAPQPAIRSTISHQTKPLWNAGQAPALQSPKANYTGVEDIC